MLLQTGPADRWVFLVPSAVGASSRALFSGLRTLAAMLAEAPWCGGSSRAAGSAASSAEPLQGSVADPTARQRLAATEMDYTPLAQGKRI